MRSGAGAGGVLPAEIPAVAGDVVVKALGDVIVATGDEAKAGIDRGDDRIVDTLGVTE